MKTCIDCGEVHDRPRCQRCLKCGAAHSNAYWRNYRDDHTKSRQPKKIKVKRAINVNTLLTASTQNNGPNGFAELVNRLIRGR